MGTKEYETSFDFYYYATSCNNLYNFASYYHQLNEIIATKPNKVLEIGIGNKLIYNQLNSMGIYTVGLDINNKLRPNIVGDIRKILVDNYSFDTVCAFEVLEHIPFEDFETALKEMHRVSRKNVIISLPIVRKGIDFYIKIPKFKPFYFYIDLPIKVKQKPVENDKQAHYWEVNKIGYSRKRIRSILEKYFTIKKEYRIPLNKYHIMYVMEKKELI